MKMIEVSSVKKKCIITYIKRAPGSSAVWWYRSSWTVTSWWVFRQVPACNVAVLMIHCHLLFSSVNEKR